MRIDELHKPAGKWCPHAVLQHGCNIYADRPQSCREFECWWLWDEDVPEELKPEKTKVVLWQHVLYPNKVVANVDRDRPDAWRQADVYRFLMSLVKSGVTVGIEIGGRRYLLTEAGCLTDGL